jgi:hypothetical protein
LLQLLLDELIIGDDLEGFVGPANRLPMNRYPQAVAVALALRYSFREDMLRAFIRRLRSSPGAPPPRARRERD